MNITQIPFGITDWANVNSERKGGEAGWADWKIRQFGDIRVRMLEYSPGYKANHWCTKGHILFCLEGELVTELKDGRIFVLRPGMSYQVADGAEPHRSHTDCGAKLFVVD
jgi:quercetin dioxygenase-like cupin family protein